MKIIGNYKKIVITVLTIVLGVYGMNAEENNKSLVVYFSHTGEQYSVGVVTEGNTAKIAKIIAAKVGADLLEIVPEKPYPSKYKPCIDLAQTELRQNVRPAYKGDIDTSKYDTIYIGYPIWWGEMPMVVFSFLDKHDLNGKTILPFCTHEGSSISGTDRTLAKKYPKATVKSPLAVRGSVAQNNKSESEKSVSNWLK